MPNLFDSILNQQEPITVCNGPNCGGMVANTLEPVLTARGLPTLEKGGLAVDAPVKYAARVNSPLYQHNVTPFTAEEMGQWNDGTFMVGGTGGRDSHAQMIWTNPQGVKGVLTWGNGQPNFVSLEQAANRIKNSGWNNWTATDPTQANFNPQNDYVQTAITAAQNRGIPPNLFLALIKQESDFNPNAKSPTGVIGITQMTLDTGKGYGIKNNQDRLNPYKMINAGADHLVDLYKQTGSWPSAVAAYNGGSDPNYVQNVNKHLPWADSQIGTTGSYAAADSKPTTNLFDHIVDANPPPQIEPYALQGSTPVLSDTPTLTESPTAPVQSIPDMVGGALSFDPFAESVNMFSPATAMPELGKQIATHGMPILGTVGSMAAAKAPFLLAAPITGLSTVAGGLINRGMNQQGETIGAEEQALMELGLPFASKEMVSDFGKGVGAESIGRGAFGLAGKLLAPAKGKITAAGKNFMEWAKAHNLPYSPSAVADTLQAKAAEILGNTGIGRWFVDRQRQKLVEGTSEVAQGILQELGLPLPVPPSEAAGGLVAALRQLTDKQLTHKAYNEAVKRIPDAAEMEVPNIIKAVEEIGGLDKIRKLYEGTSKKSPQEYNLIQRVIERGGKITKDELDYFSKSIWRNWKKLDEGDRALVGKLKGALIEDMNPIFDPTLNQTLGTIRAAADAVYHEAEAFFANTPLAAAFKRAYRPEDKAREFFKLFSSGYGQDAKAIREQLLKTGNQDMWEALKASYLENVFGRATKLDDATGSSVFQPGTFVNWYKKYGKGAAEAMPEHADALRQWYDVSKTLLKDYAALGRKESPTIPSLKLGAVSGAGFLAGGVPGVIVSNGFALLTALGTMGKGNLGFLRNYLIKESAPFGQAVAQRAAQFGTLEAAKKSGW